MDKKELLKKYWFIGVIAIALLVFIGIYAVDSYKNRDVVVNNKSVDGKYVAYSINDKDVYADDLYAKLYENGGLSQAVVAYERAIFNEGYETTQEMQDQAAMSASNALARYSQDTILQSLMSMGYTNGIDDLKQYYIDGIKQETLIKEYVMAHKDEYLGDKLGTNPRLIYHILVKCETTAITDADGNVTGYEANPTDEQKEKLAQIQEALKDENNTFEYVAYTYSDDGSSQNGGYIGLINEENRTNYDQFFAEEAMSLNAGEVSEPIVSSFGYHIIKNVGTSDEDLLNDYYYLSNLESSNPTLAIKAIMDKGQELGFEIKDETLLKEINDQISSEAQ